MLLSNRLEQHEGGDLISEQVTTEEIQGVARELQVVRNQIQTLSSQVSEYGITVEALEKQDSERLVFRSFGNLLLEVDDRDSLVTDLTEAKITLEDHLKRLMEKEEGVRDQYERLVEAFERE